MLGPQTYGFYPGSGNEYRVIIDPGGQKKKTTGSRPGSATLKRIVLVGNPRITILMLSRTGAKKRAFHSESPPVWPVFKWAHDDKFFARMTQVNVQTFSLFFIATSYLKVTYTLLCVREYRFFLLFLLTFKLFNTCCCVHKET
jgi:hypothetical protein